MKERMQFIGGNSVATDIILALCGLFMLLWPQAALKIVCIVAGVVLIVYGIIRLTAYFREKDTGMIRQQDLPLGIGLVVAGIALIVISRFFVSLLFIVAGLAMLYVCAMMFLRAYHLRAVKGQNFYIAIIIGIVILILGIVMIFNPTGAASFLVQLGGIALMIAGLGMLFMRWKDGRS